MRTTIFGEFSKYIRGYTERLDILRWFIFLNFCFLFIPYVLDPFEIKGGVFLFDTIIEIEDVMFFLFIFVFPFILIIVYQRESGLAYLQALVLFFVVDWFVEMCFMLLFEDFLFFLFGIVIFLDTLGYYLLDNESFTLNE